MFFELKKHKRKIYEKKIIAKNGENQFLKHFCTHPLLICTD